MFALIADHTSESSSVRRNGTPVMQFKSLESLLSEIAGGLASCLANNTDKVKQASLLSYNTHVVSTHTHACTSFVHLAQTTDLALQAASAAPVYSQRTYAPVQATLDDVSSEMEEDAIAAVSTTYDHTCLPPKWYPRYCTSLRPTAHFLAFLCELFLPQRLEDHGQPLCICAAPVSMWMMASCRQATYAACGCGSRSIRCSAVVGALTKLKRSETKVKWRRLWREGSLPIALG